MAKGTGGSMGGTAKAFTLHRVPHGKHKGKKWKQVPDAALRGMLEYWTSRDRDETPFAEAMREAVTKEYTRRLNRVRDPRKSRSVVRARR